MPDDPRDQEADPPPVDVAVVGTAASLDPTGTTLGATAALGVVGVVGKAVRRVVRVFGRK